MLEDRAKGGLYLGGKYDGKRGRQGQTGRYLRKNRQQSLGLEQSLTKDVNPTPHNLATLHGLVAGKQQQHGKYNRNTTRKM